MDAVREDREHRNKPMNTQKTETGDTCSKFFDIRDVAEVKALTGIEMRGDDGQPFCCGKRMQVKGGIMGPDYAKCHVCGQEIGNAASPHINGGCIATEEFMKSRKTWVRLSPPNNQAP